MDNGESIEDAAKRELLEEAGISANEMQKIGVLDFSWKDKPSDVLEVNIFKATDFSGQPQETEEMKPAWFLEKDIPFENMWPDDKYWFSLFLENKKFKGEFLFDQQNAIIKHTLQEHESISD